MGAWPGAVNVSGATLRTQTVNVTRPPGATWFLVARDRGSVSARRTVCVADPVLAWKPEGAQVALSLHWSYRLEGRPPGSDLSGRPGVDAVHVLGRLLERHRRLGGPDRLLRARSAARTPRPAAHALAFLGDLCPGSRQRQTVSIEARRISNVWDSAPALPRTARGCRRWPWARRRAAQRGWFVPLASARTNVLRWST